VILTANQVHIDQFCLQLGVLQVDIIEAVQDPLFDGLLPFLLVIGADFFLVPEHISGELDNLWNNGSLFAYHATISSNFIVIVT